MKRVEEIKFDRSLSATSGLLQEKTMWGSNGIPTAARVVRGANNQPVVAEASTSKRLNRFILAGTLIVLSTAVFLFFFLRPEFDNLFSQRLNSPWGFALIVVSLSLLAFRLLMYVYYLALYNRYKAVESVSDEELPNCTVIVPAYNEGRLVWQTLRSLVDSDYPANKLQIISLDDGSKDDTWEWMKRAKRELGERVQIYQQPKNMGKRHALYRGFQLADGDVFVTVDSDSIVKKNTLRNLVSPFVTNPKCGAVAGNVRVLNREKAFIPRMLNVSFAFSFEFIRSAQSTMGSVLCTPGALAAYRKGAVMNCLHDWINQTFMGTPSDIGEDRAMTNMILKQGYDVNFQSNAHVLTDIPERYRNLRKMLTRWERSNVRENIMMSKYAFKKFREGSVAGPRVLLVDQWIRIIMAYPAIALMLFFLVTHPILFICSTLFGTLLFSSLPALFFARKHSVTESVWAYSYGVFYAFALFWIKPYAIATASRRGWLTRG